MMWVWEKKKKKKRRVGGKYADHAGWTGLNVCWWGLKSKGKTKQNKTKQNQMLPLFPHQILNLHPFRILQKGLVPFVLLHLGLDNLAVVHRLGDVGLLGQPGLPGLGDNLVEAGMLGVLLVVPRPVLELQFGADLVPHDAQDAVDGFLVRAVPVPDRDQVGVEADGEGDSAQVIPCDALAI